MNNKTKGIIGIGIVAIVAIVLIAIFTGGNSGNATESAKTTNPTQPQNKHSATNQYVTVEGMYLDNSYVDDNGSPLKMLYVFLNISAKDKNLEVDSKYTKIFIGEHNSYESDFYKGACQFMPNYYYSSFIEDVYIGSTIKLALTFKVPAGDLTSGKDITFSDSIFSGIFLNTNDIQKMASSEAIAKKADVSGYQQIQKKREPADSATVNKVKKAINGYYFTCYVTVGTQLMEYEIEFMSPNRFELRTPFGSNQGTYDVRNNYLFCTYYSNNETIEIEYEFKNGEIGLFLSDAFNIYE